ncbi:MAG: winged helix-turn-helix transcriptional regulator [Clostridia bacterium]|nr:winged helix-turn-helix transcriptional regulator [Clostridia bacterium]
MRNVWEALSDPTRREILKILKKGELTAGEIFNYFDITKPSLSHHLSILKQAELVSSNKQGQNVIYSLNICSLSEVSDYIRGLKK